MNWTFRNDHPPTIPNELLPTQADRDAAAEYVAANFENRFLAGNTRKGIAFTGLSEAFMRHRLSTEAAIVAWQPIESAPKDGTWVLAYGSHRRGICETGVIQWVEGFDNRWLSADDGYAAYLAPTHWMALPAPPADAIEQEKHRG